MIAILLMCAHSMNEGFGVLRFSAKRGPRSPKRMTIWPCAWRGVVLRRGPSSPGSVAGQTMARLAPTSKALRSPMSHAGSRRGFSHALSRPLRSHRCDFRLRRACATTYDEQDEQERGHGHRKLDIGRPFPGNCPSRSRQTPMIHIAAIVLPYGGPAMVQTVASHVCCVARPAAGSHLQRLHGPFLDAQRGTRRKSRQRPSILQKQPGQAKDYAPGSDSKKSLNPPGQSQADPKKK
jgi:hypothetical protein